MKKSTHKIIDILVESPKGGHVDNTVSTDTEVKSQAPILIPTVEMAKVSGLKPHPENVRFYGPPKVNEALKSNIARLGIRLPLVVNEDGTTLQGNSRLRIAEILGITEVPVIRVDIPDRIDQLDMILSGNTQREKTNEERAREYEGHLEIESARAKKRQATNTGTVGSTPETGKPKSPQSSKKKESEHMKNSSEAGKARTIAATKIGWSGPTAENAAKVVKAIDELKKADPDSQTVKDLLEKLNSSVNSAFLECKRQGYIKPSEKEESDSDTVQLTQKLHASDRSYASRLFDPFTEDRKLNTKAMASLKASAPKSSELFRSLVALPSDFDPLNDEVEDAVLEDFAVEVGEASDWVCLIETRNYERATKIKWPDNAWVGLVVSTQEQIEQAAKVASEIPAKMVWLHCRIDSEGFTIKDLDRYTWVVISLANENVDWVDVEPILKIAHKEKLPVFFDSSVKCRPREMPKLKKAA